MSDLDQLAVARFREEMLLAHYGWLLKQLFIPETRYVKSAIADELIRKYELPSHLLALFLACEKK